jgi:hypothetical protein
MLDDVADVPTVATIAKPVPRSPAAHKLALAYLEASGARAITVTADADGAAISVGMKPDAVANVGRRDVQPDDEVRIYRRFGDAARRFGIGSGRERFRRAATFRRTGKFGSQTTFPRGSTRSKAKGVAAKTSARNPETM